MNCNLGTPYDAARMLDMLPVLPRAHTPCCLLCCVPFKSNLEVPVQTALPPDLQQPPTRMLPTSVPSDTITPAAGSGPGSHQASVNSSA